MLELNDDCLYEIFRQLLLVDQLSVALVCERFRLIVLEMVWTTRFRSVDTQCKDLHSLSNSQFQNFFKVISCSLEHLVIGATNRDAFTSYLGRYEHRPDFTFYLTLSFPLLVKLECNYNQLHDGHLGILAKKCTELEELTLSSAHITGDHIAAMRKLKVLTVPKSGLRRNHMTDILSHCSRLTHLNIIENPTDILYFDGFTIIGLMELQLSENAMTEKLVEHIPKLIKLRSLQVHTLLSNGNQNVWVRLLQLVGRNVCSLTIYNASSYHSILSSIANNLKYLPCLLTLHIKSSIDPDRIDKFLHHLPLKELHLNSHAFSQFSSKLVDPSISLADCYIHGFGISTIGLTEMLIAVTKQDYRKSLTLHIEQSTINEISTTTAYQSQHQVVFKAMDEKNKESSKLDPLATYVDFGFGEHA